MIEISLTTALALYSILIGIGAFSIWLYTEIRTQHSHKRMRKQYLWRCVFCGCTYLDEEAVHLSVCPRCGSYNALEDKNARLLKATRDEKEQWVQAHTDKKTRRNPARQKRPGARNRGPRRRH